MKPTVAVSITTREHGVVVKRVRREMLEKYEDAGWHPVPRHRFKVAKRRAGRMDTMGVRSYVRARYGSETAR